MGILLNTVCAAVLAILVHELGHLVTAQAFGYRPRLTFNPLMVWKLKLYQPCVMVDEPMTDTARRAFGIAGFGFEFFAAGVGVALSMATETDREVAIATLGFVIVHLVAYPFYNKNNPSNDFNKLI